MIRYLCFELFNFLVRYCKFTLTLQATNETHSKTKTKKINDTHRAIAVNLHTHVIHTRAHKLLTYIRTEIYTKKRTI